MNINYIKAEPYEELLGFNYDFIIPDFKRKKPSAYCGSEFCYAQFKSKRKPQGIVVNCAAEETWCPHCGHALYWE